MFHLTVHITFISLYNNGNVQQPFGISDNVNNLKLIIYDFRKRFHYIAPKFHKHATVISIALNTIQRHIFLKVTYIYVSYRNKVAIAIESTELRVSESVFCGIY